MPFVSDCAALQTVSIRYINPCYHFHAADQRTCPASRQATVINCVISQIWDAILLNCNLKKAGIGYFGCELKFSAFSFYSLAEPEMSDSLTGNEIEF